MTPKSIIHALERDPKGRAPTPEEMEVLMRDATADEIAFAFLYTNGMADADKARLIDRMNELRTKA